MDLERHGGRAQRARAPLLRGHQAHPDRPPPGALGHVPARAPSPVALRPRRPTSLMKNAHHACDDFHSTSETRRRSFLDTPLSRRQVIGRGIGAGLAIYAARAMPLMRILEAAEAQAQSAPAAPILVTVFLPGGCDLLDTIVPASQYGRYSDLRPGLKIDSPAALGSTGLSVNPHLTEGAGGGIKGLFEAG